MSLSGCREGKLRLGRYLMKLGPSHTVQFRENSFNLWVGPAGCCGLSEERSGKSCNSCLKQSQGHFLICIFVVS